MKVEKPLLVYDGDCGFCKFWINRWKQTTKDKVDYKPYQQVVDKLENINEQECKKAIQLILPSDKKYSAARAAFEALAVGGNRKWLWIYKYIPFAGWIFEFGYKVIAKNRPFFFKLTKIFLNEAR